MVPMTIPGQRDLVNWMQRTLNLCRKSQDAGLFSMAFIWHDCGSPMCMIGHGGIAANQSRKTFWDDSNMYRRLGLLEDENYEGFPRAWKILFSAAIPDSVAIQRWAALLNHHRRRLATMEVEAGEWGRCKRAKDMPVGRARDIAVQEQLVTA